MSNKELEQLRDRVDCLEATISSMRSWTTERLECLGGHLYPVKGVVITEMEVRLRSLEKKQSKTKSLQHFKRLQSQIESTRDNLKRVVHDKNDFRP